jgi:hypothetical protein
MKRLNSTELFAVLVSIASVTISINGNRTQERLLAASVWPYLSFDSGNTSDDGQRKVIDIAVTNSGNGPARVKEFSVEYDHQVMANAGDLISRCCQFTAPNIITSPAVGKVLRPGEAVHLLQLPFAAEIADGWRRLDKQRFNVILHTCYCSTLNECWTTRSDQTDPVAVSACSDKRTDRWHG